jgi:hypothetical protein
MPNVTLNTREVHIGVKIGSKDKESKAQFNYIVELQKLVAQILTELGRISANDHESLEKMKSKYMDASLRNADLQTQLAKANMNISFVSFAVNCTRLFLPNADDKEIVQLISNQSNNLAGMYTAGIQSQMSESSAESQLELEKYRTKTASKQSSDGNKQDCMELLRAAGANQTNASRPG